jgi:hypothetical protein
MTSRQIASLPVATGAFDAAIGYFGRAIELTGGTFRIEVLDVVANDDNTVAQRTS